MKWNADAFFAIGKTHKVCQDYARAGRDTEGRPYIVLCDGCSSSPDTDFGARLLAVSAERHLRGGINQSIGAHEHEILERADHAAGTLGLPRRSLDATLLTACFAVSEEGDPGVRVSLRGDGVVAVRRRNGHFYIYQVDHAHGAPFYLSYDLEPQRRSAYREEFGRDANRCRVYYSEIAEHRPQDGWIEAVTVDFRGRADDWFFRTAECDLVVLLSDGASSFQRAVETPTSISFDTVRVEEVVQQVLDIKGFAGSFLQRRCHKFLTKFCVDNRWQHADDFSAAAIWLEAP